MRTTVDLPDLLFRELKATAAARGTSIKTLIHRAVEAELRAEAGKSGRRVKFPILSSKKPGSLKLTNADIEEFLA